MVHLAYRENQYRLIDDSLQVNVDKLVGKPKYAQGMINLNINEAHKPEPFNDDDIVAHICGYIIQFNLKKGLELFG